MALFMHFPSKAKILMIAGLNHADLTRGHSSFFGISVRRGKAEKVPGSVSWCIYLVGLYVFYSGTQAIMWA
jgi:hypothetical protein